MRNPCHPHRPPVRKRTPPQSRGTLLWIHGLGEANRCFSHVLTHHRLAAWTHVAPDLVGHGPTGRRFGTAAFNEHLLCLNGLLSHTDPPVVVGHALGAVLGLMLCEQYPKRVRAFINVEGPLFLRDCAFSQHVLTHPEESFAEEGFKSVLEDLGPRGAAPNNILADYAARLKQCDPQAYYANSRELVQLCQSGEILQRMARLGLPKAYLYGARADGLSRDSRRALDAAGVKNIAIDHAGHWPFLDQPETFVGTLSRFLRDAFG